MGLAAPFALLFAGLYGVLVLLYLWERWRHRVEVPSLLLWDLVPEDTLRARRFRPDLLFYLQLLLLTALIVGLARPYLVDAGSARIPGRHIFVLDTTASMQAYEGGESRFDQGRAQAMRQLAELHADDEVMLIAAGHAPEVLVPFTRTHADVRAALEHAVALDVGGDLSVALAFAESARQRSDRPASVLVFTDIPRHQLPPAVRDRVTVFQTGENDDNLAIRALQITQGRFQDHTRARAYVLVENFAHRERHGFLSVRVEEQVVHRSGFTIPPRDAKGFLIHEFPAPGRVVAQLEVSDALAADNTAYGWIAPVAAARILLVSPPSPLVDDIRTIAGALPGVSLAVRGPAEFAAQPVADPPPDVTIFHRFVPDEEPAANALYIFPPADNARFPVSGEATDVEVLDWDARHPAVQALQPLAALPLRRARLVSPPPASQVLLWSRTLDGEVPLAFAGEHHARRFACVTFDLEAERLLSSDSVNVFLFFMNLLSWLTPADDTVTVMSTGEVRSVGPFDAAPVSVRDPRGRLRHLGEAFPAIEPVLAGEYALSSNGTRRMVLANFFDPLESDIGRAAKEPPVFPPAPVPSGSPPELPRREFGLWFYLAAAALCVVEWLVARRAAV